MELVLSTVLTHYGEKPAQKISGRRKDCNFKCAKILSSFAGQMLTLVYYYIKILPPFSIFFMFEKYLTVSYVKVFELTFGELQPQTLTVM